MKNEGENPVLGHWTKQEHYVFLGILQYCHIQSGSITTEEFSKVVNIYTAVVDIVTQQGIPIPLSLKTPAQIRAKLQHCYKEEELFTSCGTVNILPSEL